MVKLAVLIDALNRETRGARCRRARSSTASALLDDIRKLRGRTDLLTMPVHAPSRRVRHAIGPEPRRRASCRRRRREHDSCRVGSLAVSEPVTVHAIWESARLLVQRRQQPRRRHRLRRASRPRAVREQTCLIFNTIGPDRAETMREMLGHLGGCRFFDADGRRAAARRRARAARRVPPAGAREVRGRGRLARAPTCARTRATSTCSSSSCEPEVLRRYGRALLAEPALAAAAHASTATSPTRCCAARWTLDARRGWRPSRARWRRRHAARRLADFVADVREEYFTALAHLLDSRYYRTHGAARRRRPASTPPSAAASWSRWARTWARSRSRAGRTPSPSTSTSTASGPAIPGARSGGVERDASEGDDRARRRSTRTRGACTTATRPTRRRSTPRAAAIPPARIRSRPTTCCSCTTASRSASTRPSPFLNEFGYVHADPSMGEGPRDYHGDSVYERKALTDTEYAAYLVDFTRPRAGAHDRGGDADHLAHHRPRSGRDGRGAPRAASTLLMTNYVQLTPTGPYKFTIVESRRGTTATAARACVGFRENMDIKFLRPHEIVGQRRHRRGRRARGRQRQRGQDRRQHAARAARAGRARRRRGRPALQHAARRQPGAPRLRRRVRGVHRARGAASSSCATASARRCAVERAGAQGGPRGAAGRGDRDAPTPRGARWSSERSRARPPHAASGAGRHAARPAVRARRPAARRPRNELVEATLERAEGR